MMSVSRGGARPREGASSRPTEGRTEEFDRFVRRPAEAAERAIRALTTGQRIAQWDADQLNAYINEIPGYFDRPLLSRMAHAVREGMNVNPREIAHSIDFDRWTAMGGRWAERIDSEGNRYLSDLKPGEQHEHIEDMLTRRADMYPFHQVNLNQKFDIDYMGPAWSLAPRYQAHLQFTVDPMGRVWRPGSRGFKAFRANARWGETIADAAKRIEDEMNRWFRNNPDKRFATMSVTNRQALEAWRSPGDAEAGHTLFVVIHWEKLEKPIPPHIERTMRLLYYPPIGGRILKPFDLKAAEDWVNSKLQENEYQSIQGWTVDYKQGSRPGDMSGLFMSDQWLFGVVSETDWSMVKAPRYKVSLVGDYGQKGLTRPELQWMEENPNRSLESHADWDVVNLTHMAQQTDLLEKGQGFFGPRALTSILYRKPREEEARPQKRRKFVVFPQASPPDNWFSGFDLGTLSTARFRIFSDTSELRNMRLVMSRAVHTFLPWLGTDDKTDFHMNVAIMEEEA